MSQLQSLHLHIQALVLTEPDLDSPPISLAPCALLPMLSGYYSPNPTYGWKFCHCTLEILSSPCPSLSIRLFQQILLD